MKRTEFSIFAIALFLLLQACSSDEKVSRRDQWVKVEFPGEYVIYSLYGSFEQYMLIGSLRSIIKFSDSGASSKVVFNPAAHIIEFRLDNDTLFAIASELTYFSTDEGETWDEYAISFGTFFS